jgi:protein-tyrosine phosphatase
VLLDKTLPIATVPLDGGGRVGICRLPGLLGDPASDIAMIVEWRPRLVVSLTELKEMHAYGAESLAAELGNAGVEWSHLPIRDYGAPDGDSSGAWSSLAARIHGILDEGGAVLLHCRGGQGRSGMIGLRLLVERGEDAGIGLERLRLARPGAVETDAQLRWASEGATSVWKRS